MRKFKFFLITIISLSLISGVSMTFLNNVKADSSTVDERILDNGVIFKHEVIPTYYTDPDTEAERDFFSLTLPKSSDARIVTWTYASEYRYVLTELTNIAKNYEKEHPGWIVQGGINAEGFYNDEPTNAIIQDGDVIRKDISAEQFKGLIGFYPDNRHIVKRMATPGDGMTLSIYNDTTISDTYKVEAINKLPTTGVALITEKLAGSLNTEGYYVFKGESTLYRNSTSFPDALLTGNNYGMFVKGNIRNINESTSLSTLSKVNLTNFYLVTKNDEIKEKLEQLPLVKCEYDYADEYKNVTSMTGYMFKMIENGKVIDINYHEDLTEEFRLGYSTVDRSFDYKNHSAYLVGSKQRSSIGFTENGDIILLTANTHNSSSGLTMFEASKVLKEKGCIDAYQFDGGGSVSFVLRTDDGFKMLNKPADPSGARRIMTGLFVVTRDPGVKVSPARDGIKVSRYETPFSSLVQNLKINVNGKSYDVNDEELLITGFGDGTKVNVNYEYDILSINGDKTVHNVSEVKTYETVPFTPIKVNFEVTNITDSSFTIENKTQQNKEAIQDVIVKVNSKEYQMGDSDKLNITDLRKGVTYKVSISYQMFDEATGKKYPGTIDTFDVTTLDYTLPVIKKLEVTAKDEAINVYYRITDADEIVTSVIITIIDEANDETTLDCDGALSTTIKSEALGAGSYKVYLTVSGGTADGQTFSFNSDVSTVVIENAPTPAPSGGCNMGTAYNYLMMISFAVMVLLLKKQRDN